MTPDISFASTQWKDQQRGKPLLLNISKATRCENSLEETPVTVHSYKELLFAFVYFNSFRFQGTSGGGSLSQPSNSGGEGA